MMSQREVGTQVPPNIDDINRLPQRNDIMKIIKKNQMNYFNHLSDLFEKNPLAYFEIEKTIMDKYEIKGISLLLLLKREGKGLAFSELFYPPLKNIRDFMIARLMKKCRQQAFIQLNEKYHQNGHKNAEITGQYISQTLCDKEEKHDLMAIRERLQKGFVASHTEEQRVKTEEKSR